MLQFKNVKLDVNLNEYTKFFEPNDYKNLINIDLERLIDDISADENNKRTIPLPTLDIPKSHSSIEQTTEYKDDNRALKDAFTDFVNDVILNNENSLFNFIYIITSLFQDAISVYKLKHNLKENDIFFILKGGNVLRFVAKNFLFDISGGTADILLEFYKKFFKRSDADFSVIINPKLNNYDKIFNDMSLLTYNLLKHIQSIFKMNRTRFFEWYKYNDNEKLNLLNHLYDDVLELDLTSNDTWKDRDIIGISFENTSTNNKLGYINPPDIAVRFKERFNLNTDTLLWPIDNTNSEIYVSYNEALSFMKDRLIKFNLIRAKYGFSVHYYDKNTNTNDVISIGGELIDVSVGHRDDEFVAKFYNSVDEYISLFELSISDTRLFKFRSYSILYLFKDLYRILFIDVAYPWIDAKYVKRLNRLFYIGYIDLFTKFPDNNKRSDYLNLLLEIILTVEKLLIDENNTSQQNKSVRNTISKLNKNIENSELILDMFLEKTLVLLLYKNKESTSSQNRTYDIREDLAPYNVDKSITTTSIKDINSIISDDENNSASSVKTLYENKIDFINACKDNLEILLLSFKNIDMYCYKYAFKEKTLYEANL